MSERLVIWCNVPFGAGASAGRERLVAQLAGQTLRLVDAATPADEARVWLGEADVVLGQPPIEALMASSRVRWVEIASAGYENYDRADLRDALAARDVPVTNAGGVYADACAQHMLGMMLAGARGVPAALEAQRERRWTFAELRPRMRELAPGQHVLILGWGQIARRFVELLAPFGVEITAVRRRVMGDEPVRTITSEALDAPGDTTLARTDHLVNFLPGGAGTAQFVSAARIARLPRGARFYNVGRGSTVEQPALIAALDSGQLATAWLDVTDPEPLPPDHILWRTPNCYITPHLAGGQLDERGHQVRHFLDNLQRFTNGQPLTDRIW
jgi:phosphoglycerate dehydrogenase-like enzyme